MSRFRVGLAAVAMTMTALAVPGAFTAGGGVANAAPIPGGDIRTVCASVGTDNPATNTFTLIADCGEVTSPLTVPDGYTVEGGGHVITATDPVGVSFNGGVVTNAQGPGAHLMHVNNVIIQAVGFAFHGCAFPPGGPGVQVGLFFDDADGTATDVIVRNITQHSGCQTGNGIRANARAGIARTVTLTHVTVTGFQKNGVTGSGQMTLNVGGNSTIGPPDALPGLNSTNGVQYGDGGAGGTFTGNTVIGAGAGTPPDGTNSTGILLSSAANVTIANNTITGAGTDIGIAVSNSTNVTISNNAVGRTAPDSPDPTGSGIVVFPSATNVALICNTFSGWQPNRNIVGAVQMSCTPLPNGTECITYSADIFSVEGGTAPFTWSVSAGTLPPGLTLAPSTGAITGTPHRSGDLQLHCDGGRLDGANPDRHPGPDHHHRSRLCPTSAAADDRSPDPEDGQPESGERRRDAHVHAHRPQQRAEHGDAGRDHRLAAGDGDLPLVELDAGNVLPLGAARDLRDRHHAGRWDRHGHDQGAPAAAGHDPERDGDRGRRGGDEHGQQP